MKNFVKLLVMIFLIQQTSMFADYSIFGYIKDKKTGEPIPGASIRIVGESKGSYSSTRGKFRIPFLNGEKKLKVKSIGYHSQTVNIDSKTDTITIKLETLPVSMKQATVIGDIEVTEIIRRAIERKQENSEALKTFQGLLYSKMVLELDGSVFATSDGKSVNLSADLLGGPAPNKLQMFVLESFSRDYHDYEKEVSYTEIIQRHQTANIEASANMMALSNFFNLYQNEVRIVNTFYTTPLSDEALDYYKFELLEKNMIDDRYVYIINVIPDTELFPVLKGTIKLVEGTYNLIELDLVPSEKSAMPMITDLHFSQKFDEISEGLWAPRFLEINGKADADIVSGLLDVQLDLTATSIYSEIEVNKPLPDSIYEEEIKRISVAELADSIDMDYWENNSLREITPREREMYVKVDSLVKADTTEFVPSDFGYSIFTPYFDFNRVSSLSLGLSPSMRYKDLKFNSDAIYSFGLKDFIGSAGLSYPIWKFNIGANVFSKVDEIGSDHTKHRLLNSLMAAVFHTDYYDYFRNDGFDLRLSYADRLIKFKSIFESSRHFSLKKTTNRTIFLNNSMRDNPEVPEGNYQVLKSDIELDLRYLFSLPNSVNMDFVAQYNIGKYITGEEDFNAYHLSYFVEVPTIPTGYEPMELSLKFEYGKLENVPIQYSAKLKTALLFLSRFGTFVTVPYSKYEQEEYFIAHAQYNLTDIWWRAIGLPTYEGRGLDLVLRASTGKFATAFNTEGWYSEVGFGFKRIPTFMSNIFYWGAGASWGVGPIAKDRFNWYLEMNFPF